MELIAAGIGLVLLALGLQFADIHDPPAIMIMVGITLLILGIANF